MGSFMEVFCKGTHLVQYKKLILVFITHKLMSQSCCQTSQSHYPVACGLIRKIYDDNDVAFMCHKCNTVKCMPIGKLTLQGFP